MDERGIVIFMVDEKMSPAIGKQLLKVPRLHPHTRYNARCSHRPRVHVHVLYMWFIDRHVEAMLWAYMHAPVMLVFGTDPTVSFS